MKEISRKTNEKKRLKALRSYNICETDRDFDFITQSIAFVCDVPLCNIVLVNENEVHVISTNGIDTPKSYNREISLSQFTIRGDGLLEINDINKYDRISKPFIMGDMDVQFYAGYPLVDHLGNSLGSLNIYDSEPIAS